MRAGANIVRRKRRLRLMSRHFEGAVQPSSVPHAIRRGGYLAGVQACYV